MATNTLPSTSATSLSGKFSLPVSWSNLTYKAGSREILRGLTGTAIPSRTLAIMGSSGAGKTTFLNALCDRLATDNEHSITGSRQLGEVPFRREFRKALGFVTQDDVISSLATPESALRFSLRIRRGTDTDVTMQRVDETLQELHLDHCRDTIVGIPGLVAGLSGGERKRCNIGIELITDPKVLFLDEPTSGLDSVTSVKIVSLLRDLARKGRTVIFTIHQPTAEVLSFFDDLMLMAQGKVVYHGSCDEAVNYFTSIGYECPPTFTPTDYFMTLLQDEHIAPVLVQKWADHLEGTQSPYTTAIEEVHGDALEESPTKQFLDKYIAKTGSTFGIQLSELMRRSFSELIRNKSYIFMMMVQSVFFALIAGLIFIKLENNVQGMQDRVGLLFMVAANRAFGGAMLMINSFPRVKAVFIREQQAGAYSPFLYFLSMSLSELPVQLFSSLLESAILYEFTQLHQSAASFFYYFAVVTLESQVSLGLGLAISASVESFVFAAGLAPLIIVPFMMAGGLLASTDRLRPYWYWLEKPSFIRHSFVLLTRNEFKDVDYIDCDVNKFGAGVCAMQPKTGDAFLESMGLMNDQDSVWAMWVSLSIIFVLCRCLVVFSLNRVAKAKN